MVDDFEIDWKLAAAQTWQTIGSTAGASDYIVTNLQVGMFYDFKVRAINDVGLSLDSQVATFLAA